MNAVHIVPMFKAADSDQGELVTFIRSRFSQILK